ncbi:unnamed protein product [Meganyctiphanes norvegica]|uniref:Lipocalin/cytosolic fatty-acid binding domain-containing protein n=1 Tax=Meganyctiphanes norvegica TaxID=48144 RepID=A0AAV2RBB9_MEGNR
MSKVLGKYKLTSSEKFEEILEAVGVNIVSRKLAVAQTPVVEITLDGDTYTIKQTTTVKTTEIKFKLGEEFDETTADGRLVKSTVTLDGSTLKQKQIGDKEKKEKDMTFDRVFTDDDMTMTCKVDDIVCKRVYKRQ